MIKESLLINNTMELHKVIEKRIDALRKAAGFNKAQFYEVSGIEKQHYYDMCRGKTRWNTDSLQRAAHAFKVPVEYLFFDPVIIPNDDDRMVLSMFKALSDDGRQKVLSFMKYTMSEEGIPHLDDFRKE